MHRSCSNPLGGSKPPPARKFFIRLFYGTAVVNNIIYFLEFGLFNGIFRRFLLNASQDVEKKPKQYIRL